MPDTLDPALAAALPGTPNDVAETLRARADFERWAKDEYPNSNPPSAAWIGWHGARKFYLAAAAPQAEIDRLRSHLREHWLANIACDHEAKTDTVSCSCSMWRDEPHPSVGGAVDAWIEHVFATLHPETPNGGQNG